MSTGLPILTYHDFDVRESVLATDPSRFADQMAALHDAGFRTIDLDDWTAAGRPALDRRFALTFDDGLRSILNIADVLARHGFRATVFLITGRMGRDNQWPCQPSWVPRRPLLCWPDLRDLASAGFRYAAHTRSHPDLRRLDAIRLNDELRGSREDVEDHTGQACNALAYPYGYEDARIRRAAGQQFASAFGTRPGVASNRERLWALSRIDAYDLRSPRIMAALLDGRLDEALRWRRAARRARGLVGSALARAGRASEMSQGSLSGG